MLESLTRRINKRTRQRQIEAHFKALGLDMDDYIDALCRFAITGGHPDLIDIAGRAASTGLIRFSDLTQLADIHSINLVRSDGTRIMPIDLVTLLAPKERQPEPSTQAKCQKCGHSAHDHRDRCTLSPLEVKAAALSTDQKAPKDNR